MPPSKGVPSGPWIRASQRKMSSSETGPAVIPSGGEEVRVLYSWKRRLEAMEDAIVAEVGEEGGDGGPQGEKNEEGRGGEWKRMEVADGRAGGFLLGIAVANLRYVYAEVARAWRCKATKFCPHLI